MSKVPILIHCHMLLYTYYRVPKWYYPQANGVLPRLISRPYYIIPCMSRDFSIT